MAGRGRAVQDDDTRGFSLLPGARGGVGRLCTGCGWVCLILGKGTKLQGPPPLHMCRRGNVAFPRIGVLCL